MKAEGVGFGIWIEPEMVNPDSDLYRAHPEWTLRVPGRTSSLSRHQLVLDMSNRDVVEYLKTSFEKTFGGVPIDYIKWDMNRQLSEVGSDFLPPERQKEVPHRYMLSLIHISLSDPFRRKRRRRDVKHRRRCQRLSYVR